MSPQRLVEEIKYNRTNHSLDGFSTAMIHDACFTTDKEWVGLFCEEYMRAGMNIEIPYFVLSRADHLDESTVILLKKSGCGAIHIGVESGYAISRKNTWNKDIDDGTFVAACEMCRKHGLNISLSFIIGGPGETRDSIRRTVAFARKLKGDKNHFHIFYPFPGLAATKNLLGETGGGVRNTDVFSSSVFVDGCEIDVSRELPYGKLLKMYKRILFSFFVKRQFKLIFLKRRLGYFTGLLGFLYKGIRWEIPLTQILLVYSEYSRENIFK